MRKKQNIRNIEFENGTMTLMVDGVRYRVELKKVSPRLFHASLQQRRVFEISPSGYGIHWSLIDEDLSIEGILAKAHVEPRQLAHA